jgi:dolichol-phosphate mannosyltransferase
MPELDKASQPKTLVFIPTYNELGNIEFMLGKIYQQLPACDVLIVDDGSPDGTSELVRKLQVEHAKGRQLHLISRPGKMGIGSAHRLAMMYSISHDYDFFISMDGDGSHEPESLPEFLRLLENADFVIGSRFLLGSLNEYEGYRNFLSCSANALLNRALGLDSTEFTTAYRGIRCEWLKTFPFYKIQGQGYNFFFQCLYWVRRYGARYAELPILFHNRREGESKINLMETLNGVWFLLRIILVHQLGLELPKGEMMPNQNCSQCGQAYLELLPSGEAKCLACGTKI